LGSCNLDMAHTASNSHDQTRIIQASDGNPLLIWPLLTTFPSSVREGRLTSDGQAGGQNQLEGGSLSFAHEEDRAKGRVVLHCFIQTACMVET
jgi:hypothetical protein